MSKHPETCFVCGEGRYNEVIEDYPRILPDGETLLVPALLLLRCDICGEDIIPPESSRRIEAAVDEFQDTLTPAAVQDFLMFFQLDQTEAAEALGMGGKTLHRWVRGSQRVSRSMGYFLRALRSHPAVFEWIRERRWRRVEQPQVANLNIIEGRSYWGTNYSARFQASLGVAAKSCGGGQSKRKPRRANPARVFQSASVR